MVLTSNPHDVDKPKIKIIDFGACHFYEDFAKKGYTHSICVGKIPFMSPEVLAARGGASYDASKADIW